LRIRIHKKLNEEKEAARLKKEEEDRQKQHNDWLKREEEQLRVIFEKQKEEEQKLADKEEQQKRIRGEWEEKEKQEQERQKNIQNKQEALKNQFASLAAQYTMNQPTNLYTAARTKYNPETHNPQFYKPGLAPTNLPRLPTSLFGTENDPRNCIIYMKTGACRFGDGCARIHMKVPSSRCIMIPHFFQDVRLGIPTLESSKPNQTDDIDLAFEYEKFYDDVIGEFRSVGKVTMFKTAGNYVPHLRGNVYVEYEEREQALAALELFNGRWYAGRQLTVEFSPVHQWSAAVCADILRTGGYSQRSCPRGNLCNFLHVLKNPGNSYEVTYAPDVPFRPMPVVRPPVYPPTAVYGSYPSRPMAPTFGNAAAGYGKSSGFSMSYAARAAEAKSKNKSRSRSRSRERGRKKKRDSDSDDSDDDKKKKKKKRDKSKKKRKRTRSTSSSSNSDNSSSEEDEKRKKKKKSRKKKKKSKKKSDASSGASETSTDWSDLSED